MYYKILTVIYCACLLFMSFVMLLMYKNDKKRAKKGMVRIKEKNLLIGAILGGAVGSCLGRIIYCHKTEKKYFSFVIYLNLILEAVILLTLVSKLI